ncbi:MAG: ABC transporter permease [Solobacterium sp.]|nr:ABC transporter permease [Solobacterium sp.]
MLKYIGKRLLMLIPVLLGVTVIVFTLMYITPGDPVDALLGDAATAEAREMLREQLGLNGGYFERLFRYIGNLLHGDMGISYATKQPVFTRLLETFPNTFKLALLGVTFSVVFGLIVGTISAVKQYSIFDYVFTFICMIGNAMSSFWLGLLLLLTFCLKLKWFPASGFSSPRHWVLPAFTVGFHSAANIARMTRSSMLEVIRADYITTARAKGQKELAIVIRHALKNALIPVVTTIGMQFGALIGGSVLVESIFVVPGVGKMMVDSIKSRDYPVVQGGVLAIAFFFCIVNLIVDVLYAYIDPRIKAQYK